MNAVKTPTNALLGLLSVIAGAIVTLLAGAVFLISQAPSGPDQPVTTYPELTPTTECTQQTGEGLQSCCSEWAQKTGAMTILCTGKWHLQDGQCSWRCGE